MTRTVTLTFGPLLAFALAAGAAHAEGRADGSRHGGPRMPTFEMLDTDGDGKITREELVAPRLARQRALDADGDGIITLEEMKAQAGEEAKLRAEAMAEARFKALDTDGDGRLTAAEALAGGSGHGPQRAERLFARADLDGDGVITKEEFDKALQSFRHHAKGPKKEGHGRPDRERPGHPRGEPRPAAPSGN